tara:strand:- start:3420 stop:4061 length:642 start_codon:yes stop_codon:yes gene_type:complete
MHQLIPVIKSINQFSCPNTINFHCHTTYSDGSMDPLTLYKQANEIGLKHISITDHHSIEAYKQLNNNLKLKSNQEFKTKLWSGLEITGLLKGCLVHILALGFNVDSIFIKPYILGDSARNSHLNAKNIILNIRRAQGLSFLAHPARYKLSYKELILEAKKIGFDGVEVFYNYERSYDWIASPFICEKINDLVKENNMLKTCGTDTHGLSLLRR